MPAGQRFHAEVVVDGEKLETESFTIPDVGGVRTMLIAGLGAGDGDDDGESDGHGDGAETGPSGGKKRRPFTLGIVSGTARVDLKLPVGTIEVRALDETGRPLADKEIELARVSQGNKIEVTRQLTTAEGIARFTAVAGDTTAAVAMQHGSLRLGSDGFGMPATGGVSVELRVPARTADPSVITIGAGGRLILQMHDDTPGFIETLPLENHSDKLFDPGARWRRDPAAQRVRERGGRRGRAQGGNSQGHRRRGSWTDSAATPTATRRQSQVTRRGDLRFQHARVRIDTLVRAAFPDRDR